MGSGKPGRGRCERSAKPGTSCPLVSAQNKNKSAVGRTNHSNTHPSTPHPTASSSSGRLRPSVFPEVSGAAARRPSCLPGSRLGGCACAGPLQLRRVRRVPEGGGRWAPAAAMTQAEKGDAENGKEKGGEKEKEQRGVKRPIVPALVPESLQEVRRGAGGGPR